MVKLIGEAPKDIIISDPKELPFSHGIECELQIVTEDGKWVPGKEMKNIFREILVNTQVALEEIIARHHVPPFIHKKLGEVTIEADRSKNDAVHVGYELAGRSKKWSIIGKDSHVSFETNILEIQTPPCRYMEELEWWLQTIYQISYGTVKRRSRKLYMIPSALNPLEKFSRGVSFGDHHHIQIADIEVRRAAFNLLRDFTPHLIALSVNSPFQMGEKPHIIKNSQGCCVLPQGHLSNRLALNNRQLQQVLPLGPGDDRERYMSKMKKDEKGMRMIDINPFSPWGTIEVRCLDAQMSVAGRMAFAVLIQAIAKKAENIVARGAEVPSVSDGLLKRNRKSAAKNGLLGVLAGEPEMDAGPYFNFISSGRGKRAMMMGDACLNMLFYLKNELKSMGVTDTRYLDSLYVQLSHHHNSKPRLGIPLTPAQCQLALYQNAGEDWSTLLKSLDAVYRKTVEIKNYDPLVEVVGPASPPAFLEKLRSGGN